MENASQALFMAAGVLIAVMVISIGVYLFSSASTIAESYDTTMSATEIQKFNSKFEKYNKIPKPNNEKRIMYDYNSISDVVSAINLAYSINAENNYDIQSSIEVSIIKVDNIENDDIFNDVLTSYKMGITPGIQQIFFQDNPNKTIKEDYNKYYELNSGLKSNYSDKPTLWDLNELLAKLNESKLVNSERVYKYIFAGETILNQDTGLVHGIEFELLENQFYDDE